MRLGESFNLVDSASNGQFDAWVTRSAVAEAQDLYRMVRYGNCTISSIRELIGVPPHIETALLAYARFHPEDAGRISRVLRFRQNVRKEFDRLVEPVTMFAEVPEDDQDSAAELEIDQDTEIAPVVAA